jgi:glutamyl-tRNA reductase
VLVSNRSYDRALGLANEFGGRAVRFEDGLNAMIEADIVVSSTGSPETILHKNDIASIIQARGNRPLFLIDIAVPRDIDPAVQELQNVYLYNLDHLETIVRENVQHREQELARCQAIVAGRVAALMAKLNPPAETNYEPSIPSHPDWALGSPALCPA